MRVPLLSFALLLSACGDEAPAEAPSTDLLLERSEDLRTPSDAAATTTEPLDVGTPGGEDADDTDLSPVSDEVDSPATPASTSPGDAPAAPPAGATTPAPATPTPAPAPKPAAQPSGGATASAAQAAAMWTSFRRAVTSRNTSAIARLIADPVMVDGQSVSHADFADRVPGGDVGAFVANFGGSLTPSEALQSADRGGYLAVATATTEDGQEASLLFRIAPGADDVWRVVEITPAG